MTRPAPVPDAPPRGELKLPPTAYLPGRTPRPEEDFFDDLKAGLSAALEPPALAISDAFRGGQQAFSRRYYWEAHELLEAVWHCLPPASAERHLVQGLIQLANAGLKARLGQAKAARRIVALADTHASEAYLQGHAALLGLTPEDVAAWRRQVENEIEKE
jgi:hypothetical protein